MPASRKPPPPLPSMARVWALVSRAGVGSPAPPAGAGCGDAGAAPWGEAPAGWPPAAGGCSGAGWPRPFSTTPTVAVTGRALWTRSGGTAAPPV
ncbi:MAG: hypothetical protein QM767_01990 [Anaeromyxobacter sp.]